MTALSPTLMSLTSIEIGVSYLGAVIVLFIATPP